MNYLDAAIDTLDRSQGDVYDIDHRDRLTRVAEVYAAIALVQRLEPLAQHLEQLERIASATEEAAVR